MVYFYWLVKKKIKKIEITYKRYTSGLVLLNILQPTVVNIMSTILSCNDINGISYLNKDLFFECYDKRNMFFTFILAVPSLIIWVLIYPLFSLYRLVKLKHSLNKLEVRKKFGFLYNSYKIDYYYFDYFEIYKKYLLILLINYWQTNTETKSLVILLILGASTYYLATKNPYLTLDVTHVAFMANVAPLTTLFFGLLSFSTKDQFFIILGNIMTLILNIIFLGIFVIKLMIVYRNKILKALSTSPFLKNFINKFYENFHRKASTFLESPIRSKTMSSSKKNVFKYKQQIIFTVFSLYIHPTQGNFF